MRKHNVQRILALLTISVVDEADSFVFSRWLMRQSIRMFVAGGWNFVNGVNAAFRGLAIEDIEWTAYRVAAIPGGCSEEEWKRDREYGGVYVGPVGKGWSMSLKRGRLARWLVDVVEEEARDGKTKQELLGKMPAVSWAKE